MWCLNCTGIVYIIYLSSINKISILDPAVSTHTGANGDTVTGID